MATETLNLKPEVEAGLLAHAQAAGVSLQGYLEHLVERALSVVTIEGGAAGESGMVWEDGLLIYGAGTVLPGAFIDYALRSSREERMRHFLGHDDETIFRQLGYHPGVLQVR